MDSSVDATQYKVDAAIFTSHLNATGVRVTNGPQDGLAGGKVPDDDLGNPNDIVGGVYSGMQHELLHATQPMQNVMLPQVNGQQLDIGHWDQMMASMTPPRG
eukprot:Hpha_TRINITY_DN15868_c1_g1::TRINITY_DN15868_c1_g1_i3::g.192107::m.192107